MEKILRASIREPFHHAYLIEGDEAVCGPLCDFLEKTFELPRPGPDFFEQSYETFGIEEARALSVLAQRASAGKKVLVLSVGDMTREAQNALLKTFEDPTPKTHFFVITRSEGSILPTLRSRMMTFSVGSVSKTIEAEKFLKLPVAKKISAVEKLVKGESWKEIENLLDGIETGLNGKENPRAMEALLLCRKYMNDRGSSPKMLLENLALAL